MEKPLLEEVMIHCNWNQSEACKMLGINRGTLRTKLKFHKLINNVQEHFGKNKRALLSVSDKSGITELAKSLENGGVEIISTEER